MDYLREAIEEISPIPLSPRGLIMGTARRMAIGLSTESEPDAGSSFWDGGDSVVENNSIRKFLPNGLKWMDQSSSHLARSVIDSADYQAISDAQAQGVNLGDIHVRGLSEIEIGGNDAHSAKLNIESAKSKIREFKFARDWRNRDSDNQSGARSLQGCVGLAED